MAELPAKAAAANTNPASKPSQPTRLNEYEFRIAGIFDHSGGECPTTIR